MNPKHKKPFLHYFVRPLGFCLGFLVVAIFAAIFIQHNGTLNVEEPSSSADASAIRPPAPHSPEAVIAKHPVDGDHCWTGEPPKDVEYPGHVIWQKPSGYTVYSAKLVGPALETIFGDGHLAGRAIAFCR